MPGSPCAEGEPGIASSWRDMNSRVGASRCRLMLIDDLLSGCQVRCFS